MDELSNQLTTQVETGVSLAPSLSQSMTRVVHDYSSFDKVERERKERQADRRRGVREKEKGVWSSSEVRWLLGRLLWHLFLVAMADRRRDKQLLV